MDTEALRVSIQELDYAISMAMQTYAEIEGMKAENAQRLANGQSIAYTHEDFVGVASSNGMNHNASAKRHRS